MNKIEKFEKVVEKPYGNKYIMWMWWIMGAIVIENILYYHPFWNNNISRRKPKMKPQKQNKRRLK